MKSASRLRIDAKCRSYASMFAIIGALALSSAAGAAVRYVDAGLTTGANNGTSWADAYRGAGGVTAAIAGSVAGDEIWVAAGRYTPSTTGARAATFTLRYGVAMYGGFVPGMITRDDRNPRLNQTTLSGDLLNNDNGNLNLTDNSYHVITYGAGVGSAPVVDGFVISGGNANVAGGNQDRGGGILAFGGSAIFNGCIFRDSRCTFGGGAAYLNGSIASFTDCTFSNHQGGSFGGAFDISTQSNVTFVRCGFFGNRAVRAGGVESWGASNVTITNSVFVDNQTTGADSGGACWVGNQATLTLTNCTLVRNRAATGAAGIKADGQGSLAVRSSIVSGNIGAAGATNAAAQLTIVGAGPSSVTFSCIPGTWPAANRNITIDPLLDPANRPRPGSPCIDSATVVAMQTGNLDYAGRERRRDDPRTTDTGTGAVAYLDMGALEFQRSTCVADTDDGSATGLPDDAVTLDDLLFFLSAYDAGSEAADVDNGVGNAVRDDAVTLDDLLYFLSRLDAGC